MRSKERGFDYADLLDCVALLRTRAYGWFLAELISLLGYYVVDRELGQMLTYLVRGGRLRRRGEGKEARYVLGDAGLRDHIVEMKLRKSRPRWRSTWYVLTYDMPTTHNTMRTELARRLHEMGFAMLCASTWVSPYD